MNSKDQEILYGLAKTMEATRIELDALRIVTQGVIGALSVDANQMPLLAMVIRRCIEGDAATAIASTMPDPMIEARRQWMLRLLPHDLRALVEQDLK